MTAGQLVAVDYALGDCFRCDRTGIQTTRIGEIVSPEGTTPIRACWSCVEILVAIHRPAYETPVREYVAQHPH
ncbi:hypothetical protein PUR57_12845 [Streptomyces sp. JV176]|uniref:hypothetical protein n=1 Tax=Streptomyces sp. JV176 TaxID=858630 RepID=UPI002E75AC0D|nr:hypothetical protein [Streptomyces sp. JV176]MEE1799549.1 hypothetical protein [Streptomyces sp. JV176]